MIEETVLNRVQQILEDRGISRYRLAMESGIAQSALTKMFHQQSTLSLPTIERICNTMDITVSQFFAENKDFIDLNDNQKEIVRLWSSLMPDEQQYFLGLLEALLGSRKKHHRK